MKKSFARVLSIALAVAMVVSCAITGLVLPAAAEDKNLLANNEYGFTLENGATVADNGYYLELDTPLVPDAQYALRFEAKGDSITFGLQPSGNALTRTTKVSEDWQNYQVLFNCGSRDPESTRVWCNVLTDWQTADTAVEVRNVELLAIPADGTFNLLNGGDMEQNVPDLFRKAFDDGNVSLVDDGTGNQVMSIDTAFFWDHSGVSYKNNMITPGVKKTYKIKFDLKGDIRLFNGGYGADCNVPLSYYPGALEARGEQSNHVFYKSRDAWTTVEYYFTPIDGDLQWFEFGPYPQEGGVNSCLIDNIEYSVVPMTDFDLSTDKAEVLPGETYKIDATNTAMNAPASVLWESSDPAVATVNTYGLVTVLDTAVQGQKVTITAKDCLGTISKTATIIVDGPTVNKDIYFEDGIIEVKDVNYGTQLDLSTLLKKKEGYTGTKLTWSIAGNTHGKWANPGLVNGVYQGGGFNVANGTFEPVTLSGSTLKVNGAGVDSTEGAFSLGLLKNVVITVTDEFDNKAVGRVEWKYSDVAYDINWDTNSFNSSAVAFFDDYVVDDGTGNKVLKWDLAANHEDGSARHRPFMLEPNQTYIMSVRTKFSEVSNASVQLTFYTGAIDIGYNTNLIATATTTEWQHSYVSFTTGDAPWVMLNYMFLCAYKGAGNVMIDNFQIEKMANGASVVGQGQAADFDTFSPDWFDWLKIRKGATITNEEVGGNATNKLLLTNAVDNTDFATLSNNFYFKPYHAYRVSFKKYGGQFKIGNTGVDGTWVWNEISQNTSPASGWEAADEWVECSYTFATGPSFNIHNYPYFLFWHVPGENVYIDDFKIEVLGQTAFIVNQGSRGVPVYIKDAEGNNKLILSDIPEGETVTLCVEHYLDYTLESARFYYIDLQGNEHAILNSGYKAMTGSAGDLFTFKMPEGCAAIIVKRAVEMQGTVNGYTWGSIGSAVRRDEETGAVNGFRFLNRLFINRLNWNADGFTVNHAGTNYTVKEIGALARVATDDASELDVKTATKRGLCYQAGGDGKVRVTDYTRRYFDFTVVIPTTEAEFDTVYEYRAYMVLTDGTNEITVYTEANTDSVTAALGRGA